MGSNTITISTWLLQRGYLYPSHLSNQTKYIWPSGVRIRQVPLYYKLEKPTTCSLELQNIHVDRIIETIQLSFGLTWEPQLGYPGRCPAEAGGSRLGAWLTMGRWQFEGTTLRMYMYCTCNHSLKTDFCTCISLLHQPSVLQRVRHSQLLAFLAIHQSGTTDDQRLHPIWQNQ